MTAPTRQLLRRSSAVLATVAAGMLASCATAPWPATNKSETVYALGDRHEFVSPLGSEMKPACPALEFTKGALISSPQHDRVLRQLAMETGQEGKKNRFVVAGYARPTLPPEYARVLTEKRAHSVRQRLIDFGVDPGQIQTAGFGNDFANNGPTNDVVVIYNTVR